VTDELDRVLGEFQGFKGDDCSAGTQCNELRNQLLGILQGLKGIKDVVPGYDILPKPGFTDPREIAIEKLPPLVLYGLNTLTGPMNGLDSMEDFAQWVDTLRFYTLRPIEEDNSYRLPQAECDVLEASISTDNDKFNQMKDTMEKIEMVTRMMKDIIPKDIVINAWVGTSLPNPALPVTVFMNSLSGDFKKLVEEELAARKSQVKGCRTQAYRTAVLDSIAK